MGWTAMSMQNLRRLSVREKLLASCLAIVIMMACWDMARRRWTPTLVISTDHYTVYSSCTARQTQRIGFVAELLYASYDGFLRQLAVVPQPHEKLKLKLFKNREEFRFCNRIRDWTEGFYERPYCYQYDVVGDANPYFGMIHEATHQLTVEVARLSLAKWLNEGLACYFGTSRIVDNRLCLGEIDTNTYPIWWLELIATSGNLESDKRNGSIIPLRDLIAGSGGPNLNRHFNLYYVHWWSLFHFLQHGQDGKYRRGLAEVIKANGSPAAFVQHLGAVEPIEREWYGYVLEQKRKYMKLQTPPVVIRQDLDEPPQSQAP
jgi:hypothetical protein